MNRTSVAGIAGLAGFLGGMVGTWVVSIPARSHPAEVVRAKGFELLDETGAVVSFWGIDKNQNVVLAFGDYWLDRPSGRRSPPGDPHLGLKDPNNQLANIGVAGNSSFLHFNADDGRPRARLLVDPWGKPSLLMDDELGVRVLLGIEGGDTPGPRYNSWALDFDPDIIRLGMRPEEDHGQTYVRGFFHVNQDKVRYPN